MLDDYREKPMQGSIQGTSPERMHARAELRRLMESAIAALPETFRLVFVLREIEEHSVEEVDAMLELNPATVKTRHLRARRRLDRKRVVKGTSASVRLDLGVSRSLNKQTIQ